MEFWNCAPPQQTDRCAVVGRWLARGGPDQNRWRKLEGGTMPEMTIEQKRECLDLANAMERVKTFPGGTGFVTDLFLVCLTTVGLTVVDKAEYDQLVASSDRTK